MLIYHIATAADWRAARRSGRYETSTRGRALAEVGFIHAARRDQVATVHHDIYRGVTEPLVLLGIDTERLSVPWREDPVGEDRYPHIYGPLATSAVVSTVPLNAQGGTASLTSLFIHEMAVRMGLALLVMVLVGVGFQVGATTGPDAAPLLGMAVGLLVGLVVVVVVTRRRR